MGANRRRRRAKQRVRKSVTRVSLSNEQLAQALTICPKRTRLWKPAHELSYQYCKCLYAYYVRGDLIAARRIAARLSPLLSRVDKKAFVRLLANSLRLEILDDLEAAISPIEQMLESLYAVALNERKEIVPILARPYFGAQSVGRLMWLLLSLGRNAEAEVVYQRAREFQRRHGIRPTGRMTEQWAARFVASTRQPPKTLAP